LSPQTADPLRDPKPLIERVYAYVAYHVGGGAEAEDIVSDVFERAVRYRSSYDSRRGDPLSWLVGIARRCVNDAQRARRNTLPRVDEEPTDANNLESSTIDRLVLVDAIASLDTRDRELIALRYGAGMSTRQMEALLSMRRNTIDVALHRARAKLKEHLDAADQS
jgi:RNA polymerase sigma-70 factor, ECF subfamily